MMPNLKLIIPVLFSFQLISVYSFMPAPHAQQIRMDQIYQQPKNTFFILLENHWLQALRLHDTLYLDKLLSPDFIEISYKGEIRTKKNILDHRVADNQNTEEQLTGMNVREHKNTAIVTGINNITIKQVNRKILIRFTDVFVKKGNQWQAVSAQETLVSQ